MTKGTYSFLISYQKRSLLLGAHIYYYILQCWPKTFYLYLFRLSFYYLSASYRRIFRLLFHLMHFWSNINIDEHKFNAHLCAYIHTYISLYSLTAYILQSSIFLKYFQVKCRNVYSIRNEFNILKVNLHAYLKMYRVHLPRRTPQKWR